MHRRQLVALAALVLPLGRAAAQSAPAAGVPLEVGVLPNISARVLLAQYQPMREFLARDLARPVQVSTAPDWASFHRRAVALEYDVIVTAAHMARLAQLDRGYVPMLSYAPRIRGLLVVAKNSSLKSPAELAGQTLVLSNPQSLVALRGLQWLAEHGVVPGRNLSLVKTPTDDSVGNVVVRGDAIAAICSGGEFRAIAEPVRTQLQVHSTFAELASFVVMASPKLETRDATAIKRSLLLFAAAEQGKAFFAATGFTGIVEPEAGLLEAMDPYVEATRRLL